MPINTDFVAFRLYGLLASFLGKNKFYKNFRIIG